MENVFSIDFLKTKSKSKSIKQKKSNVRLAIDGNREAFNILIEENLKSLYVVARGILNNEHDIEDAFQNTIMNAYENIETLRKEEYFKTWLTRIMINECNKIIRKNKKVIYMEDSQLSNEGYEDTTKNLDLVNAVNLLSDDLKLTTWLFYFKDMSIEEISKTLDIAKGTVKSRLNRSRKKLYDIMVGDE